MGVGTAGSKFFPLRVAPILEEINYFFYEQSCGKKYLMLFGISLLQIQ